jgi:4-amino-4-deoxy-L-arabinose transferase-like glycosyltransferase
MVVFFAVLATWLLARNLQQPSSAHWGVYANVCALATYSHCFGALLVPAHAISLLSWRRNEIPWRKLGRSLMVFGILIAPLVILILKTGAGHLSWVPPLQPDSLLILGVDFSGLYGRMLLIPDVLAIGIAALGASRVQSGGGPTGDAWGYALFFPG